MIFLFMFALNTNTIDIDTDYNTIRWSANNQIELSYVHIEKLKLLKSIRGYEDGLWDKCIEEMGYNIEFWILLKNLNNDSNPLMKYITLYKLRDHVGPFGYRNQWYPALIK